MTLPPKAVAVARRVLRVKQDIVRRAHGAEELHRGVYHSCPERGRGRGQDIGAMSQAWGERSRLPNAGIDIDSDTHPHAHRSLDRNAYPDACANSGTGSDTHADGDLCVTSAAARLNVILSAAKNPKGFIPRQRSFAGKGLGFFTSLRSAQNDSKSASADIPRRVTQRSPCERESRRGWAWTPVCRDLCVTSAAARLNVILSAAKNPKGFIPRQRSFASKGFGFFTPLRSVQNDSETRIFEEDTGVTQRSLCTGVTTGVVAPKRGCSKLTARDS